MTGGLPALRARDVVRALERAGFVEKRVSGSHCLLAHRDDPTRAVVVPLHGTRDLKPGTLRSIIRQAGLTLDEFNTLL
ncbi:MAG TPA: type II toxin-antitoxin system HicA family toxin [Candidatus Sulfotelmatobacter sp.]|nr:type II toxin-antitoxin system HicA family toxin [Candidatus Sulfotelmatobacter sp.]